MRATRLKSVSFYHRKNIWWTSLYLHELRCTIRCEKW